MKQYKGSYSTRIKGQVEGKRLLKLKFERLRVGYKFYGN